MRRPPGPFKVVGKKKVCTYKRKLVKIPKQKLIHRSDGDPNIVYKSPPRSLRGRQLKRNLLERGSEDRERKPMKYYENLPPNYHPRDGHLRPSTRQPPVHSQWNMRTPKRGQRVDLLDLNNYRIYIHRYSDNSDELDSLEQHQYQHQGHPGPSLGLRDHRRNLLNHKSIQTQFFNPPPPAHSLGPTGSPVLVWQGPPQPKDWTSRRRPIENPSSHRPQYWNNQLQDDGQTMLILQGQPTRTTVPEKEEEEEEAIKPIVSHEIVKASQANHSFPVEFHASSRIRVKALNGPSSPGEVIKGVTSPPRESETTPPPTIGVIYVTPEPYTGDYEEQLLNGGRGGREGIARVRNLGRTGGVTRTISSRSAGYLANNVSAANETNNWRPIHPDLEYGDEDKKSHELRGENHS